jgi:CheY-like chemotaxis protein
MKWNLDVDTAENGIEAVEKAIKNRYQLIFMDIQMPEMDGSAATRKIREFETTNGTIRTPIIALTASALIEVKTRLIKEGMDDFVTKPFNPSELNYKVSLYLNKTEEKN